MEDDARTNRRRVEVLRAIKAVRQGEDEEADPLEQLRAADSARQEAALATALQRARESALDTVGGQG